MLPFLIKSYRRPFFFNFDKLLNFQMQQRILTKWTRFQEIHGSFHSVTPELFKLLFWMHGRFLIICIDRFHSIKLKGSNEDAGKAALLHRTTCLRLAATGKYEGEEETSAKMESLFIKNHSYWAKLANDLIFYLIHWFFMTQNKKCRFHERLQGQRISTEHFWHLLQNDQN